MNPMHLKTLLLEEAAYYDAQMNEIKLRAFASELDGVSLDDLQASIKFYRRQPGRRNMPSPADYIAAIPDGHPSVNEAWALIPKNDDDSVIWSEEMRMAYADAAPMVKEGSISNAFFTFKESYEKLVAESKQNRTKPKWSMSPGLDKSGRETAIIKAVEKKRISLELACKILPEIEYSPNYPQLALTYSGKQPLQINQTNQAKIAQMIKPKEIK